MRRPRGFGEGVRGAWLGGIALAGLLACTAVTERGDDARGADDPPSPAMRSTAEVRQRPGPEDLTGLARVRDLSFSPDGREIAFASDEGGDWNIWVVNLESREPEALTFSPEAEVAPQWSPGGDRIGYLSDYSGNGAHDIFIVARREKDGVRAVRRVTRHPADDVDLHFSPDGRRIVFASGRPVGEGSGPGYGIWQVSVGGGEPTLVARPGGDAREPRWSPDGGRIAFTSTHGAPPGESDIFVVSAGGGLPRKITTHRGGADRHPRWRGDGQAVFFESDAAGATNLGLVDLGPGEVRWLAEGRLDLSHPEPTPAGRKSPLVAYRIESAGSIGLEVISGTPGDDASPISMESDDSPDRKGNPVGVMSSAAWSPSGDRLAYIYSGPRTPGEIWVWSEADDSLHRVVSDRPGRSLRRALVEPEVVEVDVPESDEALPAHLYRPAGATRPSRAVVWLREGPRGPWRNDWSPEIQAMVSSGAVVIAPRLPGRGGPGAGADRELAGIEGAVRYLETHDVVDPGCRIAIGGAGHGGLLALLAAAMDPARYQGVISISGWTDLLATHERASGHLRRAIEEDVGAPGEVPVAYADLSPSQHSSRIRCPVLLIAGTHDPLVPERDTRDLARRIRQAGNRVELVLLESAGSEARTQHQRRRHVREIRRFIEEEL